MPLFSIVTPSFRQLPWLKRAVRSVADQGVSCEHLVQDGGSGAELTDWLASHSATRTVSQPDRGMYDALNKGFERASGEIFAHLNCDEQYLPGTLSRVADFFLSRPSVDIVFGGFLILNPDNTLACHRVATPARAAMIRTAHLYNFTCATFYRRRVWEAGLRFRPDLKAIADGEFIAAILEAGFRPATLPNYLATFTLTGKNLSADHATREEEARQRALLPRWMQLATPWLSRVRHLEKLMRGAYARPRIVYDIYPSADADARTTFTALNAEWRFPTYTDNGPNTETV